MRDTSKLDPFYNVLSCNKKKILYIGTNHLMILPQIIVNLFPGLTGYNERDRITKEEHYTNYFECKRISIVQFTLEEEEKEFLYIFIFSSS